MSYQDTPTTKSQTAGSSFMARFGSKVAGHTETCAQSMLRRTPEGNEFVGPCSCANTCPKCRESSRELARLGMTMLPREADSDTIAVAHLRRLFAPQTAEERIEAMRSARGFLSGEVGAA